MLEGINLRNPRLTNPAQIREFTLAKSLVADADALLQIAAQADGTSLDSRAGSDVWLASGTELPGHPGSSVEATLRRGDSGVTNSAIVSKNDDDGDRLHFTYVANGALGETEGDRYVVSTKDEAGRHRYEIVKDRATDTLVMFVDYSE